MRLLFLFCAFASFASAKIPSALSDALAAFRAEGAPGWSYRQTTVAGGKSLVERYNPALPEFERWSLLEKDGRPTTPDEQRDYREKQTRRSRGGTAPRITDSLDLTTVELISETPEQAVYRCRLKKTETGDSTAEFLRATLVLHTPTQTIEQFELSNTAPFSPALTIKIAEMKTVMSFSRPTPDRPSVLLGVTTRLRGRAFYFKSLDEDMAVTCSEHTKASSRRSIDR